MCGICGKLYLDHSRDVEKSLIKRMSESLHHRGPDGNGVYTSGHIGLGHSRLAIIDLDTGKQPLSNEDGQVWITYNGEIYNYRELRDGLEKKGHIFRTRTDTEVIVHLYEELAEECLGKLRGMFAFAIWDKRKNRLFLARDRVGIKPLYYTFTEDSFLFASEIKALLQDETVERSANPNGIFKFLTCTYTPGPETAFQDIYKLPPGHYLLVENGRPISRQYWDIQPYFVSDNTKKKGLESELLGVLEESVRIHMVSDVPVGFLLSGGLDSTGTLSFYREHLNSGIKTFTIGFQDPRFDDERKYAALAARRFGVDHYETTITAKDFFDALPDYVWFMEEPLFEPPGISLYYVTKMAREHVKVLISGEGGDEAFAGYQTYRNLVWLERMKSLLGPAAKGLSILTQKTKRVFHSNLSRKYAPLLNMPFHEYYYSRAYNMNNVFSSSPHELIAPSFRKSIRADNLVSLFGEYFRNSETLSILKKMLYTDIKTWLPDRLLLKADKMTMANSLELRVPLLDHKLLEFTARLPDGQKLNGFSTKHILKKILTNRIPNEIIRRKKAGFPTPYAEWLKENSEVVFDILTDKRTIERGYFEKQAIKDLLIDEWMMRNRYSMEMFNLMTLELWHRAFIDNGSATST